MKITCQSCQSKYTVSDEKVQGKTVKIKCRKCGATIVVNNAGGAVADPASGAGNDGSYLVNVAEGDQRSMSLQELVDAYGSGVVNGETYVWSDGMADWQPLAQVESITAALGGGVAAEVAPDPTPLAAATEPEAEAPRAAVRRDPGRRQADLFGGGMAMQTQEAPPPAAPSSFGGMNGSAAATPSGTGQRDENSVLFSLAALTAKTAPAASPSRTTASKDDSGLIDLKALADSAGPAPAAASSVVPDTGGLFPLGVPPAPMGGTGPSPGALSTSVAPPAPGKSKTPIFIAIGGVVAVLAIVGTFLATKGSGDKPVAPAETTAVAAPPPPVTATAAATDAPTAAVTAEATAAPTAEASAKAPKGKPVAVAKGGPGPAKTGNSAPPPPPATSTPAAKPKGGNCGCAASDLMCNMQCSAKGH
jgi:predicted Zn finger-like uncharacterized protein